MGLFKNEYLLPKFFFIWISTLFCIPGSAWSQSTVSIPDHFVDDWRIQRYDTKDGLPHNTITAITQDQLGYVWIGTPNGLVRFDGYQFRPFTSVHANGSSFVKTLFNDELGRVWVGTEQDVYVVHATTLEQVPVTFVPNRQFGIQFITGNLNGDVFATSEAGVYHCSIALLTCELKQVLHNDVPTLNDYIVFVSSGSDGLLYGFTYSNQLAVYNVNREIWDVIVSDNPLTYSNVIDISNGDFLFLKDESLVARYSLREKRIVPLQTMNPKTGEPILGVSNGILYTWDATSASLKRLRINNDPVSTLQNTVRSLFCVENASCWIGTLNGLYTYSRQNSPFHSFVSERIDISSIRRSEISAIEEDGNHILFGTIGGGLYRFVDRSRVVELANTTNKKADVIWDILKSSNGDIWIGAENGLFSLPNDADRYLSIDGPIDNTNHAINHLEMVNDTTIIVASFAGVWLFNTNQRKWIRNIHSFENPTQRIVTQWVSKIDIDNFMLGSFNNEILRWTISDTLLTSYFKLPSHLPKSSEGFWSLYNDSTGSVWIGSDAGLFVTNQDGEVKHINSDDGLSGNIVYAILPDATGRLWISTNQGLSVINTSSNFHDISIRSFHIEDGLPIREFNRRAALQSTDGLLWYGGIEGLTWFDPDSVQIETKFQDVLVAHAEIRGINGNRNISAGSIESLQLEPFERSLILTFGAVNAMKQPVHYRYILNDVDYDTIYAGTTRMATYTNLQPGTYTFQVWASHNVDQWPTEGRTIQVRVKAAFWQTTSFLIGVATIILFALGYAYRMRFKRLLMLERVRLSIAADLHDQVGSGLSGLAMMSELGIDSSEAERADVLKTISTSARKMAHELREIVWYTNPRYDNLKQVVERMRDLPYQLVPGCSLDLRFPDHLPQITLSPDYRRDWMMSYREVLHNIAKHSGAQNVRIELNIQSNHIDLYIADDGSGFDPDIHYNGMGLYNIRERIARIRGTVMWVSKPKKGTIVQISVPLP